MPLMGWVVGAAVPTACMGIAYAVNSGRKYWVSKNASPPTQQQSLVNKKRRRTKRRPQQAANSTAIVSPVSTPHPLRIQESSEESDGDDASGLQEPDLLQLARLHRLTNQSATPSSVSALSLASASTLVMSSASASSSMASATFAASASSVPTQSIQLEEADANGVVEWSKINRHEETVHGLKAKIAALTDHVEALNRDNREQQKQAEASARKITALETDAKERTRQFSATLIQADTDLQRTRRELENSREQLAKVAGLGVELKDLHDKCAKMEDLMAKGDLEAQAMRDSNEKLTKGRSVLQSELQALTRQLDDSRREASDKAKLWQDATQALERAKVELREVVAERDPLARQVEALTAELKLLDLQSAALRADLQELEHDKLLLGSANQEKKRDKSEDRVLPGAVFEYLEQLLNSQHSFHAEKAALVAQIVDLRRKLASS
jgi:hypothetical protein